MDWNHKIDALLIALESGPSKVVRRQAAEPPAFGCVELDVFCAATERVVADKATLRCDSFGEADEFDFEGLFAKEGLEFDAIGPLVRLTDEGVGPDGYYVELIGDRARVWWLGHDPYEARCEASLLVWLAGQTAQHGLFEALDPLPEPARRKIDPHTSTFGPFTFRGRLMRVRRDDGTEETLDLALDAGYPVIGPWPPVIGYLLGRTVLTIPVGTSKLRVPIPSSWGDDDLERFRAALWEARNAVVVSRGSDW